MTHWHPFDSNDGKIFDRFSKAFVVEIPREPPPSKNQCNFNIDEFRRDESIFVEEASSRSFPVL